MADKDHPLYTPGLRECIDDLPPLIGCEAAYFFPTEIDVCPSDRTDEGLGLVERKRGEASEVRSERRDDEAPGEKVDVEGRDGRDLDEAAASLRGRVGTARTGNATLGAGHENGQGEGELVEREQKGQGEDEEWESKEEGVAGNLAIHVRSGDIFVDPVHPFYGQVGMGFKYLLSSSSFLVPWVGCVSLADAFLI